MLAEDRLEDLLDQWEDSRERGSPIAPEVLCRDEPELLAELKSRIGKIEAIDRFLEVTSPGDPEAEGGPPAAQEIQAGRYRATRLYRPGGLGQVFYANDDELNRVVALKRLRPNRCPKCSPRFGGENSSRRDR